MSTEPSNDAADELHQLHEEKDSQVLDREPMETELMDKDRSDTGREIDGVEDDA